MTPAEKSQKWLLTGLILITPTVLSLRFRNPGFWDALQPGTVTYSTLWQWTVIPLLGCFVAFLTALGLGKLLLKKIPVLEFFELNKLLYLSIGLGVMMTAVWGFATIQMLTPAALAGLSLLFVSLAVFQFSQNIGEWIPKKWPNPPPMAAAVFISVITYALWHIVLLALSRPVSWDALAYHLSIPKLYLQNRGLLELPWLLHSHWPHLLDLFYAVPIAWGRDNAAALIHSGLCGCLIFATYRVGDRTFNRFTGIISALLLCSQPVFLNFAGTAHSDGAWALYHFMSALCLWEWQTSKNSYGLVLAGVLSGYAASFKLLALIPATALGCWVVWQSRKGNVFKNILYFSIPILTLTLPWFIKTWRETGNPVWPFFSSTSFENHYFQISHWTNWRDVFGKYRATPFLTTFLILTIALKAHRIPWPRFITFLLLPAPLMILLLHRELQIWRFLWPLMPGFCLFMGWSSTLLWKKSAVMRAFITALWLWTLWPLAQVTQNNALFGILGMQAPAESMQGYLNRQLDTYGLFRQINQRLTPQDRILLIGDLRGYYLDVPYAWGDPLNQPLINYSQLNTPEELMKQLQVQHITHVVLHRGIPFLWNNPDIFDPHARELLETTVTAYGRLLYQNGPIALIQLVSPRMNPTL